MKPTLPLRVLSVFSFAFLAEIAPAAEPPPTDFPLLARSIGAALRDHVYDPAVLGGGGDAAFAARIERLAATAQVDREFRAGFREAAALLPVSHVELRRNPAGLAATLAHLDQLQVGPEAVQLRDEGGVAILTVRTMMGSDTVAAIEAAFATLADRRSAALVVDLRGNAGGAFAIIPLVEHLIAAPVDAGWFTSRRWWDSHAAPPTPADAAAMAPWSGRSLLAFWQALTTQPVLRIRFEPRANRFDGPVFVLADGASASATEIAIAALRTAGRITVVGEKTAGRVLSQLPHEVGQGYLLSLPIADYHSTTLGRLEGRGVEPDHRCSSADAMAVALELARPRS